MTIVCHSVSFASDQENVEYKLKALYIVRLAAFIKWPEDNLQKKNFRICIDSTDQIAIQLKKQKTTTIKGRKLEILDPPVDSSIVSCDFLYLSQGYIDSSLAYLPVFTLSSAADFAEQGGMIEFYIDHAKVRMKANLLAVNKANIKLSSKLIRLLKIVEPVDVNDD